MYKAISTLAIASAISVYASADNCTKQISGYTSALSAIQNMQDIAPDVKAQAEAELQRVLELREGAPDCEVADQIEVLRKTKEALRAANAAVDQDDTNN